MEEVIDDTLKILSVGLFALLLGQAGLAHRARHDAARQVSDAFNHSGPVRAHVEGSGLFGTLANRLSVVDIYGEHLTAANGLPFSVSPRGGWKGSIRHLRLHFTDFTLRGLPVERFEADIPDARYDLGWALYKDKLRLRSAGVGPATVTIGQRGLQAFILRKYAIILSDVEVSIVANRLLLSGKVVLFSGPAPFTATGKLVPRLGQYIDLTEPEIRVNGSLLSPQFAAGILKQINPVLDADADLKLTGFFTLETVEVGEGVLVIRGTATVPPVSPEPSSEPKPK